MEKKDYHKITVADMSPHVHSFLPNENKVNKILSWLKSWIEISLDCGKIQPYYLLPSKADLACHIGVSQGTIQNVYRLLEDAGYVESKQRIGTYIKNINKKNRINKFTSKREIAVEILKKYLNENNYKKDSVLPSMRKLSKLTGITNTTLRMAMTNLLANKIVEKRDKNYVLARDYIEIEKIEMKTLVEKIADDLQNYIECNFSHGDKLPSNIELTKKFKVSTKTIHDAIKILTKKGLLHTRRGQYGTTILKNYDSKIENLYAYEKIEQKLIHFLIEKCQPGDKLPPIKELASIYKISEKTIKKALDDLSEDGYIAFARGRYGGTFVLDIPQSSNEAYKWLALSTDYFNN